jgi:putative FmdB family regulatory protein
MPTYEYECRTCGSVFEVFQSITAPALRKSRCENCGTRRPVRRLIGTGGAVLFKGSGFYQTDYRSESYSKAAKAETSAGDSAGKPEAPGTSAAPSTSAAKAETPADPPPKKAGGRTRKRR